MKRWQCVHSKTLVYRSGLEDRQRSLLQVDRMPNNKNRLKRIQPNRWHVCRCSWWNVQPYEFRPGAAAAAAATTAINYHTYTPHLPSLNHIPIESHSIRSLIELRILH